MRDTSRIALVLSALTAIALLDGTHAESDLLTRTLSASDLGRLAQFAKARADSIAEAREKGDPAEVAELDAMLSGDEQQILGLDIRGDYRCRVAKTGAKDEGLLPLVVYDWFRCRIGEDDIGYRLEKTSGSQRLSGHFIDDSATSLVFYGAAHYDYEELREYGSDPERDVVGRFVKVGDDRFRLEMPLPTSESTFDILELEERG